MQNKKSSLMAGILRIHKKLRNTLVIFRIFQKGLDTVNRLHAICIIIKTYLCEPEIDNNYVKTIYKKCYSERL